MRKPRTHPTYGTNIVGINFRERWNVVLHATKDELEAYIDNQNFLRSNRRNQYQDYWKWKSITSVPQSQNIQLRKIWRTRHANSFENGILYTVTKSIPRYTQKIGTPRCDGTLRPYQVDRQREYVLAYGDVLVLNHRDELGTLYFTKIQDIGSKYTYAFTNQSSQLCALVPVET